MSSLLLVINGPNLGLLGVRQPQIYGTTCLADILDRLKKQARESTADAPEGPVLLEHLQSNSEGEIVDFLNGHFARSQSVSGPKVHGLIVNAGALSHTSLAIRDAVEMFTTNGVPLVEVHLSNVFAREPFRHHSHISALAKAVIAGLGEQGYDAALECLLRKQRG